MKNRIVVPVDGSELSLRALDAAAGLAGSLGGTLVLCHVVDLVKAATMTYGNPQFAAGCVDALREEGELILKEATLRAYREHAIDVESCLPYGNPAEEIARSAQARGADWIVMGSHGRSGLNRMLLGSVAEGVLRHATVPVMIVPPGHAQATATREMASAAAG